MDHGLFLRLGGKLVGEAEGFIELGRSTVALQFEPNLRYRMPVVFGPMPGPRQRIGGGRHSDPMGRVHSVSSSFLTDPAALERMLPPGFSLDGEPVVTVDLTYMSELQWLAGRGYNTLGVRFPVRYEGKHERLRGPFLAILWENKADPIITGREELGFAKLFCEIHPPAVLGENRHHTASWEGHRFMEMEISDLVPASLSVEPSDGLLHYRYVPRVGVPGQADCSGAVLSPPGGRFELIDHAVGKGRVRFVESTWEQLPTLVHIVNMLAALPVIEDRGAAVTNCRRDLEMKEQRLVD
ncbi:acetoacetate decarboxylase family protein [Bradyrhizobium manausense]